MTHFQPHLKLYQTTLKYLLLIELKLRESPLIGQESRLLALISQKSQGAPITINSCVSVQAISTVTIDVQRGRRGLSQDETTGNYVELTGCIWVTLNKQCSLPKWILPSRTCGRRFGRRHRGISDSPETLTGLRTNKPG